MPGEPLAEAVAREVSYEIQKKGAAHRKVVTYYLLRAYGGVLRPDKKEQIEKVRWFPVPAALRRIGRQAPRSGCPRRRTYS